MKMPKESYNALSQLLDSLFDKIGKDSVIQAYETGDFDRSDRVKDLNKRFRWDMFWGCRNLSNESKDVIDSIVKNLNDSHIDTALRSLVPSLTRKY